MNSKTGSLLLLLILTLGAGSARSGILVDRVLVRVNGDPIMSSQLAELLATAKPPEGMTVEEAKKKGQEHLIEESLVVFAAERANLSVDDAAIRAQAKNQVDSLRKEAGGPGAFKEGLKKEALTEEELQEIYEVRLRRQALYFRMMASKRNEVEARSTVSSAEVDELYAKDKNKLAEGRIRWIAFHAPDKPGPSLDQAETKARRAKARLEAGRTFAQAAKETGGDLNQGPEGEALRVMMADLPAALGPEAFSQPQAEWGKPQFAALPGAFYVYQVDDLKAPDLNKERDRIRRDLSEGRVDQAMKDWIAGLKKDAVIEYPGTL